MKENCSSASSSRETCALLTNDSPGVTSVMLVFPDEKPRLCSSEGGVSSLTRLVGVCEVRAKVVDQVQVTPVLYAGSHLPESLLGHLDQLLSAQAEVVALICTEHLLEDVLVIRRVLLSLRTVNKPLDLRVGKNNSHPHAINVTEPHIYPYILSLLSTDGKILIKKKTPTRLLISG